MKENNRLLVRFHERPVGTLALTAGGMAAFEYDRQWLREGFPISPFSLPLRKQVFVPRKDYFQGLFGVFADSLPDAWGNLLLNRLLRRNGIDPGDVSVLDRLAVVGSAGMGALTYEPEHCLGGDAGGIDLDKLAGQCRQVLSSEYEGDLDALYRLGGTSGGARPKIMTEIDGGDWIVKFPAPWDPKNVGRMEYDYARCAEACGIVVPQTRMFPSEICEGYFGSLRFDRTRGEAHDAAGGRGHDMVCGGAHDEDRQQARGAVPSKAPGKRETARRLHMLTVAAILELDFNQPSLDYHDLMKLTAILTGGCREDMENLFRRMCFNVFAHNRDDHSKNFSFLYHEESDEWHLSPAYDLTYSTTYYGEHTTTVDGEGAAPGPAQLLAVGRKAGLPRKRCQDMMDEVRECVNEYLGKYLSGRENG